MSEGLTKKQLKELRKLEKMQNRNIEQKNNSFKWIAISVVSALFLLMFVGIIVVAKNKNNPKTEDGKVKIADNGRVRTFESGENESTASAQNTNTVTLVEYADLQCPACKLYHPDLKQLLVDYKGQLRLVFKHFPLTSIHPNAQEAAIASEAVNKQGKFFEYIDILYEKQEEWSGLQVPDEKFEEYAKSIGIDIEKYRADIKESSTAASVEEHRNEGIANGVTGTPSFFLNNERIVTPANLTEFKKVIDEALKSDGEASPAEVKTEAPKEESVPNALPLQE